MAKKSGNKQQKLTAQQKSDRIKAAKEREARAQAQRERSAKMKKIFTVVVCVILVLALGIPTIALSVLTSRISMWNCCRAAPWWAIPHIQLSLPRAV